MFLITALALAWLALSGAGASPPTVAPSPAVSPAGGAPPSVPELMQAGSPPAPVDGPRVPAPGAPIAVAPSPGFPEAVDALVATANATAAFVADERTTEAERNDALARERFAALLTTFADAAERALDMLATIPAGSVLPLDIGRRTVLGLVLTTTLGARHQQAEAAGDHSQVDPLVAALLTVMHAGGETAVVGRTVLVDRPLLRLAHEAAVLELVERAGAGEFPRDIATALLMTLWHNLQRSGERSAAELSAMAMLLMADADPSRRATACRQLLLDDRYRPVVLAWLREHRDVAVTADVSAIAARELPPRQAAAALRELSTVIPNMPGAYMLLASRAEEVVVDQYVELLAAGTDPEVRRDLVCGLGMARGAQALATVELALGDPAGDVRTQAMVTMSALFPDRAEAACNRVLDDPRAAGDSRALAMAVVALENLAAEGLVNAVDRLGQRLRGCPLPDHSRQRLEQALARSLPGGRTSR